MTLFDNLKKQLNANPDAIDQPNLPWMQISEENSKTNDNANNMNNKKIVLTGIIILVVIIIGIAIFNFFKNNDSVTINKNETNLVEKDEVETKIQVHITGEVKNPGVYALNSGSRIMDGINAAGGFTDKADKNSLNLAKTLEDGEQILILSIDNQNTDNTTNQNNTNNNGKININTADLTALQSLSGVGPATAQKIIDYRTANGKFKAIEDLKKVSGIGEKTFEKFKDKICV